MEIPRPGTDAAADIDRAALTRLVERFRRQHALRLRRTASRLLGRQRRALEALPMLYHRNHPALPGYVGPDVPAGISGFTPRPDDLVAIKRVARSYDEPRLAPRQSDLQAIFIMGSGGTVGHGSASDIDLWVCCDTLLHSALWPKVRMIDQWAGELGLELHTFLVDPDVLRVRQRLPGTRIPTLVLDEFYRSGALMAGRHPLWWLIAAEDPETYQSVAERLLRRRFVTPEAVVDFGPVPAFPAEELAQAAITELDRALTTPHKSLLKLKLMEAYARAPELGTVSGAYKARMHAGETDPLRLDPYLLLYEHVRRYLDASGRGDQIPFVRRLLMGKTAENARVPHLASAATQTESALLQRFLGWGFGADDVARFRELEDWTMAERQSEHRRIMTALEDGLALVENLVEGATGAPPPDPLLGPGDGHQLHWMNETRLRHLQFAMSRLRDRGPAAIPTLHPALVGRRRLVPLTLDWDASGWHAREGGDTVMSRPRAVEIAVWAELNGATLRPQRADATVTRDLAQILQGFRGPHRRHYAFLNAEPGEAETVGDDSGLTIRPDPLRYVGYQHLTLSTLDVVSRGDDGHWRADHARDDDLPLLLARMLARPPSSVAWQVIGSQSRFVMAHRLEQLHELAAGILDAPGAVFVLPLGRGMITIRRRGEEADVRRHPDIAALRRYIRDTGCATLGFDPTNHHLKNLLHAG